MTIDTARLRELAEESQDERGEFFRARLELSLEGPAILALLAERDALVRERDAVLAANRDCLLHYDDARAERDAMAALLREARDGLAGGLWDYGPGQDEHDRCNELIEKLDAALSGKEPT
jgi:hypothetical protein